MLNSRSIGKVIYLLLTVFPLAAGLAYALGYSLGLTGILATGFTFEHWRAILSDQRFYTSIFFSLWVASVTILISTLTALFLTIRFRDLWKRSLWEWGLYLPLAYPAIVAAFIGFQLWSASGLFSRFAHSLGLIDQLEDFPGLIQDPWGIGIIVMHSLMAIPFLTIFLLSVYQKDDLERFFILATSLGASRRSANTKVIIPALVKRARPLLVLYTIFIAGAYEAPLLLGTQRPQMVTIYVVNKINRFDLGDRPQAYAAIILVVLILLLALSIGLLSSRKSQRIW